MIQIPLALPEILEEDIESVTRVMRSGRLSLGPEVEIFEQLLAQTVETKYAIAVSTGTSALHLIWKSLGISAGDEIITTPFSFIASSNSILFENAKPVFVDIDRESYNINPDLVEAAITEKTKAILAVDVFGRPADLESLSRIAKKHHLHLVDDCCEALGSNGILKNATAGAFGFYPNKQITCGEGGAIVTNDPQIADLCKSYRNQGRNTNTMEMVHERLGYNYRLSDMSCAMLTSQLKRLSSITQKRRDLASWYNQALGHLPIRLPMSENTDGISWFVYVIELPLHAKPETKPWLIDQLRKKGIGSSTYFPAIHTQPFYQNHLGYKRGDFPETEYISDRTVALPFSTMLTQKEVAHISHVLEQLLKEV